MDTLTKPTSGPRDFFIHVLAFVALYVSAVSLFALWFQYINIKFPDALNYYYSPGFEGLRWPMAILIIVFPVFLILARWISKQIAFDPQRKELCIYKWLVYFTLFASAVTVIVDLITLIYNFLGGDLTTPFLLKVLVILLVASGIFGYYFWHLRSDVAQTGPTRRLLLWASIVVVIGSIILGFWLVGSPMTARARRFDDQKVQELQNISYQIQSEFDRMQKLPQTVENYEYRITDASASQLCA